MTTECACPTDYPDWHEKDVDLGGTLVHTLKLPCFLFMPLSYELYVQKQSQALEQLELEEQWPGFVLTRTGFLRGEILRLLKPANSASRFVRTMDGKATFHGYLHNGGIGTIKESTRQLQNRLFDMGRMPKDMYLSYLTCPVCSEKKGGDKILLLRRWQESKTLARRIENQNRR